MLQPFSIRVLGSGPMGKALALACKQAGHRVHIGSRTPAKLEAWATAHGIQTGTFAEIVQGADLCVLAVQAQSAPQLVQELAVELTGKIVIDCTRSRSLEERPMDVSWLELLQSLAPHAAFVKAFSQLSPDTIWAPEHLKHSQHAICGDHLDAKDIVSVLLEQMQWAPNDLGHARHARLLEKPNDFADTVHP